MGLMCCKEEAIDFDGEVELNHFDLLSSVGKGAFGKVRIVRHKNSQKMYALKYINKDKCMKMKATDNIIAERKLLMEIDYPFICNLRYAFQDDENLFMVIDLMLGGDLRFHLDRMGVLTEEMVRFYTAEIGLGLNYLHERKMVHRDLKPDNVLLDEHGHAHLTDFNIAVHFREDKPLMSIAGSLAYMAPDILAKKGYGPSCDWWSLGAMSYELLFGRRPFRGKSNEELTESILHGEIEWPISEVNVSAEAVDCIKQLLSRDLTSRLGARESGGFANFKSHPWFFGFNWEQLESKSYQCPFTPDSKRANFDATHELEEILLEDNPLRAKPRKQNKYDPSRYDGLEPAVARDLRVMEEKFAVFDYTKPKVMAQVNNASSPTMSMSTGSTVLN